MKGSLQEKNKKYYAVFRYEGKQKWVNLQIPTKKGNKRRAEEKLQKVLQEYAEPHTIKSDILFVDFLPWWVEQIKPTVKPATWETYHKVVMLKLIPYFKSKRYRLCALKGMNFTGYFAYLKKDVKSGGNGLSKKTIMNIRGVISSALNYAVENGLIADNVIRYSRLPIFEDKSYEPTIYTPEQIKNLLSYARDTKSKACLFLHLEMLTGARKGELLGLTWDKVDFEKGTIYICQNRTGSRKEVTEHITSPKTANAYRTLPLSPLVMKMLKEEKNHQEKQREILKNAYFEYSYDYVIRQEDGRAYNPNSINRIINKMTEKIGLPHCRVHDYRHLVASVLFDNGTALRDVSLQLGHGQTSTTEKIYVHKSTVVKPEKIKILQDVFEI